MNKKTYGSTDSFRKMAREIGKQMSPKDKEEMMSLFKKENGVAGALRIWLSEEKDKKAKRTR